MVERSVEDSARALLAHNAPPSALANRTVTVADGSSPAKARKSFRGVGPQSHNLPQRVIWSIVLLTAAGMALINFCTIFIISFVVEWKFSTMQAVVDSEGVAWGILTFVGTCMALSSCCMGLIFLIAPSAGSSGAPENKGWLNGNHLPDFFTQKNMIVRQFATMLANMSGYPVGREGPTVTLGSNLAFLIAHRMAMPHVRQWVEMDLQQQDEEEGEDGARATAEIEDKERLIHAKRICCTVGGACGMAMLFDSPIGGIVYMFEEISSSSWPMEVTMRAFVGTTFCSVMSRGLLNLCGTTTKAFVVYEFRPIQIEWQWSDMPFFIALAALLGVFSAFHTRWCLMVAGVRQRFIGSISKPRQTSAKVVESVLFIAACSGMYTLVALLGKCFQLPAEDSVEFVRYNCPEGEYNPVASLLLTTSEGAVKRLFSTKNAGELHMGNECLAFVIYSLFNICLTGIPVPSGNFTGSMLIGGLAGRIMGAAAHHFGYSSTPSGIFAMIGSAAMLAGFKQMCVAVVVFISGCANDLNLVPPLMVSVAVALLINREINERGFDEEQIMRKKIPFLPAEPPHGFRKATVETLMMQRPPPELPPEMPADELQKFLREHEREQYGDTFPVVKHVIDNYPVCIGFTFRDRLEAAVQAAEIASTPRSSMGNASSAKEEAPDAELKNLYTKSMLRRSMSSIPADAFHLSLSQDAADEKTSLTEIPEAEEDSKNQALGPIVPIARLSDTIPYTILEGMPAARAFAPFAKLGVTVACVVSELGMYRGMITKASLIELVRLVEEGQCDLS